MKTQDLNNRTDIRLANWLGNLCARYKTRCLSKQRVKENEAWDSLFKDHPYYQHKLDGNTLINLYKDSILCRIIYKGFEEDETIFLRRYLKPGDVFFDVGANIGLFSLIASNIIGDKGNAYTFEPTPETYRRLLENIELNSIRNIHPIQAGVSNASGELTFNVSDSGFDAWNSFANISQLKDSHQVKVKTTTLNTFIEENSIQVSDIKLIKIDVEGWEKYALLGADKILSDAKSPVLMVEFTEDNAFASGYYCGEVYDYVAQFGYKWYRYDSNSDAFTPEEKQLHYPYDNLFAIKNLDFVVDRITH